MKDGTKFEAGKITDAGEKLVIQTKYGDIAANKSEVANLEELGLALRADGPKTDGLEFVSEMLPDTSIKVDYYTNKEKIGTQLFTQAGILLTNQGKVVDGTYREYYSDGKLKKEKTIIDGLNNGTFKIYYPNGTLQSEAYYISGKMNGGYKYYSDAGKLLLERNYINGVANGYFRDYDENGALKAQTRYVNGEIRSELAGKLEETSKPLEVPPAARVEMPLGRSEKKSLVFVEGEVFTVGGADKEWKNNLKAAVAYLSTGFDYVTGEITSYPGYGANLGVNLSVYKESPSYLAVSYVKGPSADIDVNIVDSYYGTGSYAEEINTSFYRVLVGYKLMLPMAKESFFSIDLNAGFGGGKIESESTLYMPGLGTTTGSFEESWTGFTWSIGPTLAWESSGYIFELGGRYTVFPELKDSDTFSDVKWKPFSIKAGLAF